MNRPGHGTPRRKIRVWEAKRVLRGTWSVVLMREAGKASRGDAQVEGTVDWSGQQT